MLSRTEKSDDTSKPSDNQGGRVGGGGSGSESQGSSGSGWGSVVSITRSDTTKVTTKVVSPSELKE